MSGMVNIERYGPVEVECGLLRETRDGPGEGPGWASSTQAFLPLGSHPTEACGQDNRKLPGRTKLVLGSRNPIVPISPVGMGLIRGLHRE